MTTAERMAYKVQVTETVAKTYRVTTSGDKSRAAELAEMGDYGLNDETVEEIDETVLDTKVGRVDLMDEDGIIVA